MSRTWDAIVVGSGPNGLCAAIELARRGFSVCVLEAAASVGGGMRTGALTLPGFAHDECSAIHPTGVLSPYMRTLPLAEHGLQWLPFPVSVAHPFRDGPAALLDRSPTATGERLGVDAVRWQRLFAPFLEHADDLLADILGPLRLLPRRPLLLARFGMLALQSAEGLAQRRFAGARARALFAGLAGHSVLPLDFAATAALGIVFGVTAHVTDWPCALGGSVAIARALEGVLLASGGEIECNRRITSLDDLTAARIVLFDLAPRPFVEIARDRLPASYLRRLLAYRYGPGTYKLDWALDGPIPWNDPAVGDASTVHVGGTLEEIAASERAAWEGRVHDRPYLIVCQQSRVDPGRAPAGKHTGYAYCHVPNGSEADMTEHIEAQIERFAPGFRDRILARHVTRPMDFETLNPNYVGGAITGGAADLRQLFTRPVARFNPYTTPDPRLLLCSASTPPGGGVHGMCGYYAAQTAIRRLERGR